LKSIKSRFNASLGPRFYSKTTRAKLLRRRSTLAKHRRASPTTSQRGLRPQPRRIEQEGTEGTEILLLRFLCFLLFKKLVTKTSIYELVIYRGLTGNGRRRTARSSLR
jgi:hypothetical protein